MDNPIDDGDDSRYDDPGAGENHKGSRTGVALWGDFDDESAREQADRDEKDRGVGKFLKLKEGKTILRVLPPARGEKVPFKTVWEHNLKLPGGNVAFACPRNNFKLPCPACQQESKLKQEGMDERAKGFRAKKRYYANVIVRGEEELGPRIWGFGAMIEEDLMSIRNDGGVNFSHPISGVDLIVTRKGTGENDTEYKVIANPKGPTPLASDEVMQELAESMHDLGSIVRTKTASEIIDAIAGRVSNDRGGNRLGSGEQPRGGGAAAQLRNSNRR
jgi:hypothetical protein